MAPHKKAERLRALKTDSPPSALWERYRFTINDCYIDKKLGLKEVIARMKKNHNFHASVPQYKTRLRAWGIYKNKGAGREEVPQDEVAKAANTPKAPSGQTPSLRGNSQDASSTFLGTSCTSLSSSEDESRQLSMSRGSQTNLETFTDGPNDLSVLRNSMESVQIDHGIVQDCTTAIKQKRTTASAQVNQSTLSMPSTDSVYASPISQLDSWTQANSIAAVPWPAEVLEALQQMSNLVKEKEDAPQSLPSPGSLAGANLIQHQCQSHHHQPAFSLPPEPVLHNFRPEELFSIEESRWSTGSNTDHDISQLQNLADLYSALGCRQHAFSLSWLIIVSWENKQDAGHSRLHLAPGILRMVQNVTDSLSRKQVSRFIGCALSDRIEFKTGRTPYMCLLQSYLGVLSIRPKSKEAGQHCSKIVGQYRSLLTSEKLDYRLFEVLANVARLEAPGLSLHHNPQIIDTFEQVVNGTTTEALLTTLYELLNWVREMLGNQESSQMYQYFPEELWTAAVNSEEVVILEHYVVFCYLYEQWMESLAPLQSEPPYHACNHQLAFFQHEYNIHPNDTLLALAMIAVDPSGDGDRRKRNLEWRTLNKLRRLTDGLLQPETPNEYTHHPSGKRLLQDFFEAHLRCLQVRDHRYTSEEYENKLQQTLLAFVNTITLELSDTIFNDDRLRQYYGRGATSAAIAQMTFSQSPASSMSGFASMKSPKKRLRMTASRTSINATGEEDRRPHSKQNSVKSVTTIASDCSNTFSFSEDGDMVDLMTTK